VSFFAQAGIPPQDLKDRSPIPEGVRTFARLEHLVGEEAWLMAEPAEQRSQERRKRLQAISQELDRAYEVLRHRAERLGRLPGPPAEARVSETHDLGPLVAYTALEDGTPVYDRDGRRIGVVEHVIAVGGIFEGVVIHTHPLPGRHLYADADQIAEIHERGVVLSTGVDELHDPSDQARSRRAGASGSGLEARLRHAWDWITGRP
jgi:Protein of unknown function (DUF2630)